MLRQIFLSGPRLIPKHSIAHSLISRSSSSTASASSLFDAVVAEAKEKTPAQVTAGPDGSFKTTVKLPIFTTGNFKGSHRKVNHLTRIIKGMSLSEARIQMQMNLKRPANNIRAMLHRVSCVLKHNYQLDPDRFYIQRAWVGKGVYRKALKIHGRGRFGIMHHPKAHVKIMLGERNPNPTVQEKEFALLAKMFRKRLLFVPMKDDKPIQFSHPVWSRKPWKYVTSPKWIAPENALPSDHETK